ncbi:hypothetical protein J5X84_37085 [Streptosporangiaceae bacterium NEAU-GS5]|nr:hypothetical protein [Streptosporangiaceae bacterium NEAU-GS5]
MDIEATHERTTPIGEGDRWSRRRRWAIRLWYGVLGLWALSMARGIVYLSLGMADPGERFVSGSVTAWKLLATGGVLVICWTGGRSVVAFHALVVGWTAWLLSERLVAVPDPDQTPALTAVATIVIWLLPLVLLVPDRRRLLRLRLRPSAIMLPLALAAAIPLVIYAVHYGALSTGGNGGTAAHYDACGLGAVLAAQAVFAALRPRDNRWLPRIVAFAGGWIGLMAIIWPGDVTSPGRVWGAALICWAVLFATAAELEARRGPDHDAPTAC